jgi:hypothetical protein
MGGTIFTYHTPFPEVVASIQLQAFIPAHHLGAKVLYFGATSIAPAVARHCSECAVGGII